MVDLSWLYFDLQNEEPKEITCDIDELLGIQEIEDLDVDEAVNAISDLFFINTGYVFNEKARNEIGSLAFGTIGFDHTVECAYKAFSLQSKIPLVTYGYFFSLIAIDAGLIGYRQDGGVIDGELVRKATVRRCKK